MKISIVTPTYNRSTYINDTIESILSQKGDFDLEYIIQDGGSDNVFISMLEEWKLKLDNNMINLGCNSIDFKIFSEKDKSMYEAINKGFKRSTGDVMAWLNSDDMYHPFALQTVSQIFKKFESVDWLTGVPNSYNSYGSTGNFDNLPGAYSRNYIRNGYYRLDFFNRGFNWIQQESTFWRRGLWEKSGEKLNTSFKYAADFHLWRNFANYADLVRVNSFLGGFRIHDDQLTTNPALYRKELSMTGVPPNGLIILKKIISNVPKARRLFFNTRFRNPLLRLLGLNYDDVFGKVIVWSFADQEWQLMDRAIL